MVFTGDRKMKNRSIKIGLILGILALLFGTAVGSSVNGLKIRNQQVLSMSFDESDIFVSLNDYIDITVEEAWDFLSDISNGIQIPIDVRGVSEWRQERIDTPYPEDPKRYSSFDEQGVQEFISLYDGKEIILYCKSGGRSQSAANILVANEFNGIIYNMVGGINAWKQEGLPTKFSNHPPNQPSTPTGPIIGVIGISYNYSTSTIDPDDDSVKYGWSWDGNEIVDEWTSNYPSGTTANISHSWSNPGTYEVLVKSEDNVGDQSEFSLVLTVNITTQPDPPIINGPTQGASGQEHEYIFSAMDPDGDNIYLYIEWGDGNIEEYTGPYQSEEEIIIPHIYSEEGTYTIRSKAKDIYDIESDWGALEVNMPKNKNIEVIEQFSIFLKYLFNILYQYGN